MYKIAHFVCNKFCYVTNIYLMAYNKDTNLSTTVKENIIF